MILNLQLPRRAMMVEQVHRNGFIILLTLVIALVLEALPLPEWAARFHPSWALLVLIYWAMAIPERVSIFSALAVGLIVDGIHGSLLGQHALSFTICIYLVHIYHKRLRLTPVWQLTLIILGLVLIDRLVAAVVLGITRGLTPDSLFWLSAIVSMILWPWVFVMLKGVRRRFGVN